MYMNYSLKNMFFYARLAKNKQKNHPYNKGYHKAIIEPLDKVHKNLLCLLHFHNFAYFAEFLKLV